MVISSGCYTTAGMELGDCCDVTDDSMLNYSWNVFQFKASESAAGGAEEELKSSCCRR